jgi:GNAT superfamily N-acetyltransferase
MAKAGAGDGELKIVRLTPGRIGDMAQVLRGTWGSACYCLFPRMTESDRRREHPGQSSRAIMTKVAAKRRAPGLLAYVGGEPAGWVAVAPRPDLRRIDRSKATPRVDEVAVWVIPCITVRRGFRRRGVARALISAAVEYAASQGAPAVEAYPRAGDVDVHDDFAFIGTEALFRKAGFRKVRGPLQGVPRTWTPRVTMRVSCTSKTSRRPRGRSGAA